MVNKKFMEEEQTINEDGEAVLSIVVKKSETDEPKKKSRASKTSQE